MSFVTKCYTLLVVIYFQPWSLTYGDILTKNYTSYQIYPWCTPSDYMRYPTTHQEVVAIVKESIARGVTVKAFGSRHSQTDIICTEGIPIDMTKLKSFRMNSDGVTATFGAGVTLREATEFLRKNKRALRTTPAFGNITIGGAIGTGAHGSTVKYNASLSSQVVKMRIVDGLGKLQVISKPDDLKAFRIHLGLLGIVVDVTLFTVPVYKVLAHNYVVSDDILTNGEAIKWVNATDQISFNWFPAFNEVVVVNLTFVDAKTEGNAATSYIVPSTYDTVNIVASTAKEVAGNLISSTCAALGTIGYKILHGIEYILELSLLVQLPDYVPIYSEDGVNVKNPAVGYSDLMFAPVCVENTTGPLACVWAHGNVNANITIQDNEFALALNDLPDFIKTVKDIISKTPTAFPLGGILIRFSSNSTTYMSTAYGRDTAHFEFFPLKRKDFYNDPLASLAGYQTILQTAANEFKGRSHWGKSGLVYHNSESLDLKLDPIARENFVAAMDKFDPNEIFINNFGRRMKESGSTVDFDPLTIHCAILDNCFCSKNSDCGSTQICTSLPGYSYPVCKTINEVPEKTIDRNALPTILGLANWLLTTLPTLITTSLSKCPLTSLLSGSLNTITSLLESLEGSLPGFLNGALPGLLNGSLLRPLFG